MHDRLKIFLITAGNILFLCLLIFWSVANEPFLVDFWGTILLGSLAVFTMFNGIKLAGGLVSLLPMVAAAAYMVLGPIAAAWLFFVAAWLHGLLSFLFAARFQSAASAGNWASLLGRTAVNATMAPAGILFGSFIYHQFSNSILTDSSYPVLILFWGLGYFFINYLSVTLYFVFLDKVKLRQFWQKMPQPLLYEIVPLPFAPLVARIYTDLGWDYFLFLMLALVFFTFIVRNLNEVSLHLNRRVLELDSLKNVGQTLSAGLEIESVLAAIHVQVSRLMPVDSFYIALYDAVQQEVSFPFVIDEGQRMNVVARRGGNGLVEYVLREQRPLLITKNVAETAQTLNLTLHDRAPACWLGVPIMLVDEVMGVVAVQSYVKSNLYGSWHEDVLSTIAAQTAMVIQNARLYAQTGSQLARRVQELNSILSTIQEGILLFDLNGQVVKANEAMLEFAGLSPVDLAGKSLFEPGDGLLAQIGYQAEEWARDCAALQQAEKWRTSRIVMRGKVERHVERTLVPVRDMATAVTGWLLIFRDITDEIDLAQSREETIHMLVHDLRSPLSVTLGSLETISAWLEMGHTDDVQRLLDLAHNGGQRMLQLLNNLLDSYKLENGSMTLNIEPMPVLPWLKEVQAQFTPAAANAGLTIDIEVASGMPMAGADKGHMLRVLSNLVDNAVKFTPNGGCITLWARQVEEAGTDSVLVGVTDTGAGIPVDEQGKLFVKFQQSAAARGRRQGTGLGLTYCKLMVEAHNGRIWVESEGVPGKGSTFLMVLPVYENGRS